MEVVLGSHSCMMGCLAGCFSQGTPVPSVFITVFPTTVETLKLRSAQVTLHLRVRHLLNIYCSGCGRSFWGVGGGSVRKHLERANLGIYISTHPLPSLLKGIYIYLHPLPSLLKGIYISPHPLPSLLGCKYKWRLRLDLNLALDQRPSESVRLLLLLWWWWWHGTAQSDYTWHRLSVPSCCKSRLASPQCVTMLRATSTVLEESVGVRFVADGAKLQALVYDILPSTTAVFFGGRCQKAMLGVWDGACHAGVKGMTDRGITNRLLSPGPPPSAPLRSFASPKPPTHPHSEHRFPAPSSKLCQIWLRH